MKVLYLNANDIPDLPPSSAAIGYFDGFHVGHMELIRKAVQEAKEHDLKSAVITFHPDPWEVFKPDANKDHIISLPDKVAMATSFGLDYMYILEFSQEFANRSVESFHNLLARMHVEYLVCGYDFTYGRYGAGNVQSLHAQDQVKVCVIDEVDEQEQKISSSRIERMLRAGLVWKAAVLLGYYYSIPGVIVHGYKRGTDVLQMPTANLQAEPGYVLPANGVYAGYVYDGTGYFPAMINIGSNPTFNNGNISIEAHIFGYDKNLYGRMARFFFAERIRPEVRFDSIQDLKNQLKTDDQRSREILEDLESKHNLLAATVDLWAHAASLGMEVMMQDDSGRKNGSAPVQKAENPVI